MPCEGQGRTRKIEIQPLTRTAIKSGKERRIMRGGFESKDILRFPFERQHAPTIDNLRRVLPEDKAIRSLQCRFGQKRLTRETMFRVAYADTMQRLCSEGAGGETEDSEPNFDVLFADGITTVFRMLGEAQRAHDELASLTRQAVDAITESGQFEGPDQRVDESDFRAAGLLVHGWAAGVEMLGRYRAAQDWQARVANDPFPPSKRKKSSKTAPKAERNPGGGTK